MADALQRLIKLCPFTVRGEQNLAWGANFAEGRTQIRRAIGAGLAIRPPLDLRQPPQHEAWSISISHTPSLGAWVAVPLPLRIGFDIEQSARLNSKIIARIATPAETARAPDAKFVWSAKEAVFKAGSTSAITLNEIELLNWQTCVDPTPAWTFFSHQGQGWLLETAERIYALYVVSK